MVISAFLVPLLGSQLLQVPFFKVLPELNKTENANISRLLNTLASFFTFLIPSLILARVLNRNPFSQLGFSTNFSGKLLSLVLAITFASMVLSGSLGELNALIPIPDKWYAKAKALEAIYKTAMMSMAYMRTFGDYLIGLLVIAAAPAIFEEVLFRAGFQQIFIGWTKSKWAGILITSIFFSAFHFSYFGFLPRLGLGIVLGLIFFESKNLWLNILLHFLNNAIVVTELYLVARKGGSIEKTFDESMPVWWGAFAILLLIILFIAFRKESKKVLLVKSMQINNSPENIFS